MKMNYSPYGDDYTGNSLREPCDYLLRNCIDAEYDDDPVSYANLIQQSENLGALTIKLKEGENIRLLREMRTRARGEIHAYYEAMINGQHRTDSDAVNNWLMEENERLDEVSRIIDRHIQKIVIYSYGAGPYRDSVCTNEKVLFFDSSKEVGYAAEDVLEYMQINGLIFDETTEPAPEDEPTGTRMEMKHGSTKWKSKRAGMDKWNEKHGVKSSTNNRSWRRIGGVMNV